MVHTLTLSFINKCVPFVLPYLAYNMKYAPAIHIRASNLEDDLVQSLLHYLLKSF